MEENAKLYDTHVFICESCGYATEEGMSAPGIAAAFRKKVKELCKDSLKTTRVRINGASCLGLCERGINAVAYPEGQWWHDLRAGDEDKLALEISEIHLRAMAREQQSS
jgi:predicted metal-binding protein